MASTHLSNEEFLTKFTSLIHSTTSSSGGSIFLSQKPLLHGTQSPSDAAHVSDNPLPLLVRVTNGNAKKEWTASSTDPTGRVLKPLPKNKQREKRVKLSTVVQPTELEAFFGRYAEIAKTGMAGANGGLRKRDRTKRKKKKPGEKAAGVEKSKS